MTIGTRLFTLLRGRLVGTDSRRNRYYVEKDVHEESARPVKRWVLYARPAEASAVSPEWHAWLHRITDRPPSEAPLPTMPWEQEREANATGTPEAYRPPGHLEGAARRAKATGDYEPWRP